MKKMRIRNSWLNTLVNFLWELEKINFKVEEICAIEGKISSSAQSNSAKIQFNSAQMIFVIFILRLLFHFGQLLKVKISYL